MWLQGRSHTRDLRPRIVNLHPCKRDLGIHASNDPGFNSRIHALGPDGGVPPTYSIDCTGYSLIGPRIGDAPITAEEWLDDMIDHVSIILGYTNGEGYDPIGDDDLVYPGNAYWVYFSQTGERVQ